MTLLHQSIDRRVLLQAGASGFFGLNMASLYGANSSGSKKSVIVVNQTGAPSHIDTLDPKPEAPVEIGGKLLVFGQAL